MIYRVVLKVSYYERWFDFEDIMNAADFAQAVLYHEVPSEDHKSVATEVIIKAIDETKINKQEEE